MAYAHGGNDAQKTMGVITLALVSSGHLATFTIPLWVKLACALTMALGTYSGGWRIMHTLGAKVIKLDPIHGFAAETSAATVIQIATHFGFPVSTTHTITAAIMGVGATQAAQGCALGRGRQHRHGLGPHPPGRRTRRRRRVPRRRRRSALSSDPGRAAARATRD